MVLPVPPFWERTVIVVGHARAQPTAVAYWHVSFRLRPVARPLGEGAEPEEQPMASPHGRAGNGLYDPTYEHDACGVAFVARLGAPASHEVVERALCALDHLEHRGAEGADADTGDGAGILIQLPTASCAPRRCRSSCPSRAATAWPSASCRATRSARDDAEQLIERDRRGRGPARARLARRARGRRRTAARPPAPRRRTSASCSWPPATASTTRTRSSASST